jgi:hypothetical protein
MNDRGDAEGRAELADQINAVLASAGIHYRLRR